MARRLRPQMQRLQHPLNPHQVEALDNMLEELFKSRDSLASDVAAVANVTQTKTITAHFSGIEAQAGKTVYLRTPVDVDLTLIGWTLLANDAASGAAVVDVWVDEYGNFPPTDADSITGGNEPEIPASGPKAESSSLSGWDTAIPGGSIIAINLDSITTITHLIVHLYATVDSEE